MDRTERLAAYLDGDLAADDRSALEAELAGDASLRAELAAMRRADAALAAIPASEPPEGFEQRLRDHLAPVIAEEVAHQRSAATDELTARRARRGHWPALAAAAAGILALVVGGVVLRDVLPSGGDDAADAPMSAQDESLETEAEEDADTGDDAADAEAADPALDGPVIVADERSLDEDVVGEVLDGAELGTIAGRSLDEGAGSDLAARFQSQLGGGAVVADEDATEEGDGEAAPGRELTTREGEPLEASVADDVAHCLDQLLDPGVTAIPVYVELGQVEGIEAILYGLVTIDPDTGSFDRSEVWVLERSEDCQVVRFEQR